MSTQNKLNDFGLLSEKESVRVVLEEMPIKKLKFGKRDIRRLEQAAKVNYFLTLIRHGHDFPPIIIDDHYKVQDGEFRLDACRRLGAKTILVFRPEVMNE